MIEHSIAPYATPAPVAQFRHYKQTKGSKKFQGTSGSGEHKKFIFERAISQCHFELNDHVLYKRNPYQIVDIYMTYGDHVEWDGLKPRYIELWDHERPNEVILRHHSELRRKR